MCDTFVAMGSVTEDGAIVFGKNSDRDCNEPQPMIRNPRIKHDLGAKPMLKATFIEIPQVEETYAVVLSKPSWMWGCEMGFNEFGLTIGNEAMFTKEDLGPPALTGMDMVRLALERCKTADEALDCIINLMATYGQGGDCGYQSSIQYHNGFIVADTEKAWILETAGVYWAAKQVKDFGVISNGLSIGKDFDRCHPELIKNAIAKAYCKSEADFDFTKAYAKSLYKKFTKYEKRRCLALDFLKEKEGKLGIYDACALLRLHEAKQEGKEFTSGSMASICMHGGGVISSQSTASLVARLCKDSQDYLFTAASTPCISVFKPFWMESAVPLFSEDEQEKGTEYWARREEIHRMILAGRIEPGAHKGRMKEAEKKIKALVAPALAGQVGPEEKTQIAEKCMAVEEAFISEALAAAAADTGKTTTGGGPIFRKYWKTAKENLHAGRTVG